MCDLLVFGDSSSTKRGINEPVLLLVTHTVAALNTKLLGFVCRDRINFFPGACEIIIFIFRKKILTAIFLFLFSCLSYENDLLNLDLVNKSYHSLTYTTYSLIRHYRYCVRSQQSATTIGRHTICITHPYGG